MAGCEFLTIVNAKIRPSRKARSVIVNAKIGHCKRRWRQACAERRRRDLRRTWTAGRK